MSKIPPKKQTTYSPSDARKNLYWIVKDAGAGLTTYEITQKNGHSVVVMSKEEYDGWQETLDILSNPREASALLAAEKETKTYSWDEMLKINGITHEDLI